MKAEGLHHVAAIALDVSNDESVKQARKILGHQLQSLDILINNAGMYGGSRQTALEATIDQFKATYDANVYGVVRVAQAYIDLLKNASAPRIVNVSSSQDSITLHSDPSYRYYDIKGAVYLSSKSAMNMYTFVLAYELKDTNFKVNAVCPGFTKTDFNGHRGLESVEDAGKRIVKYALIDEDGPRENFSAKKTIPQPEKFLGDHTYCLEKLLPSSPTFSSFLIPFFGKYPFKTRLSPLNGRSFVINSKTVAAMYI